MPIRFVVTLALPVLLWCKRSMVYARSVTSLDILVPSASDLLISEFHVDRMEEGEERRETRLLLDRRRPFFRKVKGNLRLNEFLWEKDYENVEKEIYSQSKLKSRSLKSPSSFISRGTRVH